MIILCTHCGLKKGRVPAWYQLVPGRPETSGWVAGE
jgi:hypothetical protein